MKMVGARECLCVLLVLPRVYLELVETHEVIVNSGEDAHLNCTFLTQLEVLQVTWQKEDGKTKRNVGAYNPNFGPIINSPFKGKVEFINPGLLNCSIVIRNVTLKDECCYKCLFNTFPHQDIYKKQCIKVHELYEPNLLTPESNITNGDQLVSCSATGHPAPTVTWDIPGHLPLLNSSTVHIPQPNGTITVTSTGRLKVSQDTVVRCVASLSPGGGSKEASMLIQAPDQGLPYKHVDQDTKRHHWLVLAALLLVLVFLILVFFWKQRKSSTVSESENKRTPEKTSLRSQTITTPHGENSSTVSEIENVRTPEKTSLRSQTITTPHGDNTLTRRMLPNSPTDDCSRNLLNYINEESKRTPEKTSLRSQTITTPHGDNSLTKRMLPNRARSSRSTVDCNRDLINDFNE